MRGVALCCVLSCVLCCVGHISANDLTDYLTLPGLKLSALVLQKMHQYTQVSDAEKQNMRQLAKTHTSHFSDKEHVVMKEAFYFFDENQDGSICMEELLTAFRRFGLHVTLEQIDAVLEVMDVDQNHHELNFDEFLLLMSFFVSDPTEISRGQAEHKMTDVFDTPRDNSTASGESTQESRNKRSWLSCSC